MNFSAKSNSNSAQGVVNQRAEASTCCTPSKRGTVQGNVITCTPSKRGTVQGVIVIQYELQMTTGLKTQYTQVPLFKSFATYHTWWEPLGRYGPSTQNAALTSCVASSSTSLTMLSRTTADRADRPSVSI